MSHLELTQERADLRSIASLLDGPEQRRPNRPETVSLALVALLRGPPHSEIEPEPVPRTRDHADEPFVEPTEAAFVDSYDLTSVKIISTSLLLAIPLWMIGRGAIHLLYP